MLILVAGLPGSGKSYFAEKLAERLGIAYINSDRTRIRMMARGRYEKEDKLAVYTDMRDQVEAVLAAGESIIADATFYLEETRNMFIGTALKYHVSVYLIVVRAEEDLIRRRLLHPRRESEADYSVYEKIRDQFEPLAFPHLPLVSTDQNLEEMLNRTMAYIGKEA